VKAAVAALVLAGAAHAHAHVNTLVPQTPEAWRQAAVQDIEEAVRITLANHPGAHDPANPRFRANLEDARQQGLALAARVDSAAGYRAALQRFNVTIGDGHAGFAADLDPALLPVVRWPGFVTTWRGDGLYVAAAEEGGPPAGARVESCDGKPMDDLIRQNVFAFDGHVNEPGHWWSRARKVFVDYGNPFVAVPRHCRFTAGGKTVELDLAWQPNSERMDRSLAESYNGKTLDVGLTEPRKGLFWAAMPTFMPDDKQRDAYRAMVREVETGRQRFLDADAVVIDLRQNQGGSSVWSRTFAEALWGKDRVERRLAAWSAQQEVWWRASQGNADFFAGLVEQFTREGQVESLEWATEKSAGLHAALARGDIWYVQKDGRPGTLDADLPTDPPAFTRPVYVIVPGQCASACLDALDTFTRFPNTKLIGAPSSADSTYMEVRTQKVASGLALVVIPNKMYVNRPRANGQGYVPAIYVNDPVWSVDVFRKVVEDDLARQRR
jgi:hypothetical protein